MKTVAESLNATAQKPEKNPIILSPKFVEIPQAQGDIHMHQKSLREELRLRTSSHRNGSARDPSPGDRKGKKSEQAEIREKNANNWENTLRSSNNDREWDRKSSRSKSPRATLNGRTSIKGATGHASVRHNDNQGQFKEVESPQSRKTSIGGNRVSPPAAPRKILKLLKVDLAVESLTSQQQEIRRQESTKVDKHTENHNQNTYSRKVENQAHATGDSWLEYRLEETDQTEVNRHIVRDNSAVQPEILDSSSVAVNMQNLHKEIKAINLNNERLAKESLSLEYLPNKIIYGSSQAKIPKDIYTISPRVVQPSIHHKPSTADISISPMARVDPVRSRLTVPGQQQPIRIDVGKLRASAAENAGGVARQRTGQYGTERGTATSDQLNESLRMKSQEDALLGDIHYRIKTLESQLLRSIAKKTAED